MSELEHGKKIGIFVNGVSGGGHAVVVMVQVDAVQRPTVTRPNECFIDRGRDVGVNDRTLNNGLVYALGMGGGCTQSERKSDFVRIYRFVINVPIYIL